MKQGALPVWEAPEPGKAGTFPAQPLIVAHRGASRDAPENTIEAFKLAWEQGADAIEGDFHLTKDGHVVCIHDANTKRTAGESLVVAESSLEEFRKLDVGSHFGEPFQGARIPTLAEVLATVPQGKNIYLDIKCGPSIVPPLLEQIAQSGLQREQVVVITGDEDVIRAVEATVPAYDTYFISQLKKDKGGELTPTLESILTTMEELQTDGLAIHFDHLSDAFIDGVKAEGFALNVWTVDRPKVAQRLHGWGVRSITTNVPDKIRKHLSPTPADSEASKSQLVKNLAAGKKQTVVTFGTSLTKVGAWVPQLGAVLEQHYPGQVTLINGAQGGANSDWGRDALDQKVLQHQPDTVFIEFAVNDAVARRRTSVQHARKNLEDMIERILKTNPNCEIILMVMNPPVANTRKERPNLAAYNQMYRDVAKERKFQLIDHYPVWEKVLNEDPGRFMQYVPDTIHPVREGALNVITPTIVQALGMQAGKPEANQDTPCWDYLFHVMDQNKNREVTRKEFSGYWARQFAREDANQDGGLNSDEYHPPVIFKYVDANQDGQITPAEHQRLFASHFDHRDNDKDAVLTVTERRKQSP
jgi:glycerophosphoryl diester phosphodiesterase